MPPPAADAPCPEQAFNATALKWHTCAWLLLPVLVFLTGWMHWYAALPLTLLTAAGLAPRKRKEPQTRDSLPAFLYASGGFPAYGDLIPAVCSVLLAGFPQESPLHLYAGNRPDSAFLLRERRRQ